jgi:hypothetical protein
MTAFLLLIYQSMTTFLLANSTANDDHSSLLFRNQWWPFFSPIPQPKWRPFFQSIQQPISIFLSTNSTAHDNLPYHQFNSQGRLLYPLVQQPMRAWGRIQSEKMITIKWSRLNDPGFCYIFSVFLNKLWYENSTNEKQDTSKCTYQLANAECSSKMK